MQSNKLILGLVWMITSASMAFAEDSYPGDAVFIRQAAVHSMFEVKAGKLALKNAASDDVRTFGGLMLLDNDKIKDQLQMMAKLKEWTLPTTLDTRHQSLVDQFEELKQKDFDREYSAEMDRIHKIDKESFKNAAKFAADPDLRKWAGQVETIIDQHLEQVPVLTRTTTTTIEITK